MHDIFHKSLNILITDDHLVIQQGLSHLIKDFLTQANITIASNLSATVDSLREKHFDLLILDINIPGGDNFEMIAEIRKVQPAIKILLFSAYSEDTYGLRYIRAGVNGYLEKNATEKEIQEAVTKVLIKGSYISAFLQEKLSSLLANRGEHQGVGQLSNRELEIARFLINGKSTGTISLQLNLKLPTVSTHKNRIFEKLQISNVFELIKLFKSDIDDHV